MGPVVELVPFQFCMKRILYLIYFFMLVHILTEMKKVLFIWEPPIKDVHKKLRGFIPPAGVILAPLLHEGRNPNFTPSLFLF